MPAAERPEFLNIVLCTLLGFDCHLHPAAMDDQEEQQVDGAVTGILELLLLDTTRVGTPDRVALQHLEVGLLIDGHHPDALAGQPFRMGIAPKDLLRAAA